MPTEEDYLKLLYGTEHPFVESQKSAAAAPRIVAQESRITLEEILMDQAVRETGGLIPDTLPVAAQGLDIQFDDDEMLMRATPNEAVRFQVGREAPPIRTFQAAHIPVGGEVVARRGPRGFESVRERGDQPYMDAFQATGQVRGPVASTPPPVAKPSAPSVDSGPTRLERLLGPSLLDD